ncbi:MAG TPA: ABC transporter ATP-binding protein [Ignavibacteria bacterium]|nr:ABC transporter ATP-binding protein [Ignavibacteria bacterium]
MISVRNLTKKYSSEITALDDVSFEINKGEICGYIGTNGAGKSTTVKILIGVLDFDKGEVLLNGTDVKKDPFEVKKIVGYVPEIANLFNSLSPKEYINFIGEVRNIEKNVLQRRLDNFAEVFDFKELLNESIGNLSKGNKQKVLITSSIIHDPEIIFFDEPLNGLDANAIFVFQDLVSYLISGNKTILYCSHLLNTIEKVSTKIILLDKGKIIIDSKTEDLKKSENYTDLENIFRNLDPEKEVRKISYESLFD